MIAGKNKKLYIAVIGTGTRCSDRLADVAKEIGSSIAVNGAITVCGGIGGIFEKVFEGARQLGGTTIAITSDSNCPEAYPCDYLIPTGMISARHSIIANMCNGGIILGGWIGSLELAINFLTLNKPIVALRGTGGVADTYSDKLIIEGSNLRFTIADRPKEAISLIFQLIS